MVSAIRLVLQGLQQKRVLGRTLEQIKQLQQTRLHQLVQHAKSHSPFYAERFRDINPDQFEVDQLPVTSKAEMMKNFDRFLTVRDLHLAELEEFMSDPTRLGQWYRGQYALSRTSGSSGMQAVIVQ